MDFVHSRNQIALFNTDGSVLAEVTFPTVQNGVVNVNHTFVDDSLRGQGIAGKLMQELVADLQHTNRKATLSCSYAAGWFAKHPEYDSLVSK